MGKQERKCYAIKTVVELRMSHNATGTQLIIHWLTLGESYIIQLLPEIHCFEESHKL